MDNRYVAGKNRQLIVLVVDQLARDGRFVQIVVAFCRSRLLLAGVPIVPVVLLHLATIEYLVYTLAPQAAKGMAVGFVYRIAHRIAAMKTGIGRYHAHTALLNIGSTGRLSCRRSSNAMQILRINDRPRAVAFKRGPSRTARLSASKGPSRSRMAADRSDDPSRTVVPRHIRSRMCWRTV